MEPLPQTLCRLIEDVIRHTRLWPSEKRDVRAELESHFREGLADLVEEGFTRERAAALLQERFGNPKLAAKLIRRGKKRGRAMMWKLFVRVTCVFVFLIAAIGVYAGWIALGRPTPSIDYVAKLNESLEQIPEQDRAWPLWREIILEVQRQPEALKQALKQIKSDAYALHPADKDWPAAMEWLEANRHLILQMKEVANKPVYGRWYGHDDEQEFEIALLKRDNRNEEAAKVAESQVDPDFPPLISLRLPGLRDLREIVRLLLFNAHVHLQNGEWKLAGESIDVAHRLGWQLLDGVTIIEQLVGASSIKKTAHATRSFLYEARENLTREQCQYLTNNHLMTANAEKIQMNPDGENLMFEDTVQYVFTDNGTGDGHLIPQQFDRLLHGIGGGQEESSWFDFDEARMVFAAAIHADRKETLAKYHQLWDRLKEQLRLPLYDPDRRIGDIIKVPFENPVHRGRYGLIAMMLPTLERADMIFREIAMDQAATQMVIRLLEYRVTHGEFPATLDALISDDPTVVPVDVYTGQALCYSVNTHGEMLLYSIGGNFADDGGSSEMVPEPGRSDRKITADIVYWPPLSK